MKFVCFRDNSRQIPIIVEVEIALEINSHTCTLYLSVIHILYTKGSELSLPQLYLTYPLEINRFIILFLIVKKLNFHTKMPSEDQPTYFGISCVTFREF